MKKKKAGYDGVTDRFSISVQHKAAVYECMVEELMEGKETYYHFDVLSPYPRDMHDHIRQMVYHIEMRVDCATGKFRIKTFGRALPDELVTIEPQLSDALCARH